MYKHTFGYPLEGEAKEAEQKLSTANINAQAVRIYKDAAFWNLEFQTTGLIVVMEQRVLTNLLLPSAWRIIFNHLAAIEAKKEDEEPVDLVKERYDRYDHEILHRRPDSDQAGNPLPENEVSEYDDSEDESDDSDPTASFHL